MIFACSKSSADFMFNNFGLILKCRTSDDSDHDILCICGKPNLKEDMIRCDGQNCKF